MGHKTPVLREFPVIIQAPTKKLDRQGPIAKDEVQQLGEFTESDFHIAFPDWEGTNSEDLKYIPLEGTPDASPAVLKEFLSLWGFGEVWGNYLLRACGQNH